MSQTRRDIWGRLIGASIVASAAAVVLCMVHCGLFLLGGYPNLPVTPWLLIIPLALAMAVAIVLTGLACLAALQRPCDSRGSSFLRRLQRNVPAAVASLIPLMLAAGLVVGMSALTRWLDSR